MNKNKIMDIGPDPQLLGKLEGRTVLVKYGGNAMVDESARKTVFDQLVLLHGLGIRLVVVHGGGPYIQKLLDEAGVTSEFVGGHRKTGPEAMKYVEMALSGQVNGEIVRELNARSVRAVGLSGKDAAMVRARKRLHRTVVNGEEREVDLGQVGDVSGIDTALVTGLLDQGFVPVVAPVAAGEDGRDYNVNADMFAGHLAGALKAAALVAMTNVDGLLRDLDDPGSLIETVRADEIRAGMGTLVRGGMIPKIESCLIALENGAGMAHIVNGMKKNALLEKLLTRGGSGTTIEI